MQHRLQPRCRDHAGVFQDCAEQAALGHHRQNGGRAYRGAGRRFAAEDGLEDLEERPPSATIPSPTSVPPSASSRRRPFSSPTPSLNRPLPPLPSKDDANPSPPAP